VLAVDSRLQKQPTQARSRLTVDAFLEAADRVLRRDGYEAASTNRLARVAGFSVGSLYQYFDDKQAVVGTLIDRELRQEARDLIPVVEAAASEWATLLRSALAFAFERRTAQRHLYETLIRCPGDFGGRDALAYARRVQAPLAGEAIQRAVAPHLVWAADGTVEPALTVGCRLANAVSCWFAVEAPAHVPAERMVETLARVIEAYAERRVAPSAGSLARVAQWRADACDADGHAAHRMCRLQELRAQLLGCGIPEPQGLEAALRIGSSVDALVHEFSAEPPGRHSHDCLATECARVLDALERASAASAAR